MDSITLKYTFELENGATREISIKDVKDDVTEAEILGIAESFIEKNTEYKGSKITLFVKCDKIITNTETIVPS